MSTAETNDILRELGSVLNGISEAEMERVIGKLNAHRRLFFYGAGRSGLMLRAFCMRLMQMGKQAYVVGDTTTPAIGAGDLLCLASASGRTESVVRYAEKAVSLGAELLVITAGEVSPLTQIAPADIRLPAAKSAQPLGSLFEQAVLLAGDAIIRRMNPDENQMRVRHANLE